MQPAGMLLLSTILFATAQTAPAGQRTASPAITTPVTFVNDVLPVLSKVGCNAGICHGAADGKGGFKLSLRGYAPPEDFRSIVHDMFGRRVDRIHPHESLLLQKPTAAVAHQGGRLLDLDAPAYRVLLEWLRQGAPGPSDEDPQLLALEVDPASASLAPGETRSLRVWARFNGGQRRDVTVWTRFDSNDAAVAAVSEDGRIDADAPGLTAISATYQDQVAAVEITVPYPVNDSEVDYDSLARRNYIDDLVVKRWKQLRLRPSPPADDAAFLRRVYQDLTGTLPEPAVVRSFLASSDPQKRDRLVDRLLESPAFVDMWAQKWGDIFRASREWIGEKSVWTFHRYLRDRIQRNVPWDQVVRELVAGDGDSTIEGAANFFRLQKVFNQLELWPLTAAETTAQTFLGVRLQCARCHNHPKDRWTQADYYGFAGFFARVTVKQSAGGGVVVHDRGSGEIDHPRLGRPLPPKPLDGPELSAESEVSRRVELAQWITAPDNPFFARATANRIWRHFMGRGLVEPVDEFRASNPPSNPALLDALAADWVEHGFDVKHLMRRILQSHTYRLASTPLPENRDDERFYSHYRPKRLTAEQLLDAIGQVTGVPERFAGLPVAFRAAQLPDTKVASTFLDQFGRPLRRTASCECERIQGPNLGQVLELMHSPVVADRIRDDGGLVNRLIQAGQSNAEIVDEMYLRTLSRFPGDPERQAIQGEWESTLAASADDDRSKQRRAFFEDLLWALLNSKEFLFNH